MIPLRDAVEDIEQHFTVRPNKIQCTSASFGKRTKVNSWEQPRSLPFLWFFDIPQGRQKPHPFVTGRMKYLSQIEYMLRSYPLVPKVSPWVRDIPHLKQCGSVILRFRWHLVTKMAMYDLTGYIMRSFLRISARKTEKDLWIRRWLKEEGAIEFM